MARIKHVAYIVEDLEKTGAFFEDLVGFRRAGHIRRAGNYPGSALDLTDGEINLTLLCPDADVERRPWAYGTFGPNHIGIETDRAAEIHTKLEQAGVELYADGARERGFFKFKDPNGVEIDISPPGRWRIRRS